MKTISGIVIVAACIAASAQGPVPDSLYAYWYEGRYVVPQADAPAQSQYVGQTIEIAAAFQSDLNGVAGVGVTAICKSNRNSIPTIHSIGRLTYFSVSGKVSGMRTVTDVQRDSRGSIVKRIPFQVYEMSGCTYSAPWDFLEVAPQPSTKTPTKANCSYSENGIPKIDFGCQDRYMIERQNEAQAEEARRDQQRSGATAKDRSPSDREEKVKRKICGLFGQPC